MSAALELADRILARWGRPDLAASSGEAWLRASRQVAPICRALRIDPADPVAPYATAPFALMRNGEGEPCVAGAVGMYRLLSPLDCNIDDATVILWNPLTGALSIMGQTGAALILPNRVEARLPVYGEGYAFFRAWADRRAATFTALRSAAALHRTAHAEPLDSDIPGALAIGDLRQLNWLSAGASVLVAGPGIKAADLNRAVIRSARLPRIESLAA